MNAYYCSICGKSTYDVDVDYLIGFDHLQCHLDKAIINHREIHLENWNKLGGRVFNVGNTELTITDCEIKETSYTANIYQTKYTPSEPLIRVDLWFDGSITLKIFPPDQFMGVPIQLEKHITKEDIQNPLVFLYTIVHMLKTAPTNVTDILKYFS
jgi:hypothetical protein